MKKIRVIFLTPLVVGLLVLMYSCEKDDLKVDRSPSITGFLPEQGRAGDVVTITGKNFSKDITSNIVKFNTTEAIITAATTTQLTVTVPSTATTGKVSVDTNGKTVTSAQNFVVTSEGESGAMTITDIYPLAARSYDTITITGTNFRNAIVLFYGHGVRAPASIVSSSPTQIRVKTPYRLAGEYIISVYTLYNGPLATFDIPFMLLGPTIESVSSYTPRVRDTLTITGTNFSDNKEEVSVGFSADGLNYNYHNVVSSTMTQIRVVVLTGYGEIRILVKVGHGMPVSYNVPITVHGPSITSMSPQSGRIGEIITITGTEFSDNTSDVQAFFYVPGSPVSAQVVSSTTTQIQLQVPSCPSGVFPIGVSVSGVPLSYLAFEVKGVTITSLSSFNGQVGDVLTITGTNFSDNVNDVQVFFQNSMNTVPCTVVNSMNLEVQVQVPNLAAGDYTIMVSVFGEPFVQAPGTFTVF